MNLKEYVILIFEFALIYFLYGDDKCVKLLAYGCQHFKFALFYTLSAVRRQAEKATSRLGVITGCCMHVRSIFYFTATTGQMIHAHVLNVYITTLYSPIYVVI